MEDWAYIVIGLFLLFLLLILNLLHALSRHRRALREAHLARASSMLQGAARYLDNDAEPFDSPSAVPVETPPAEAPLSAADVPAQPVAEPPAKPLESPPAALPASAPSPPPSPAPPAAPSASNVPPVPGDYVLVASVELHFAGSTSRVGVKGGTHLHGEFLRVANRLLDDLAAARRG